MLLFALPAVIVAPAIVRGDVPLNLDPLTTRAPWHEARVPGADKASDDEHATLIERYYPWYAFINMAGMQGELPLWNPYEGFGAPFLALWRTRALSPFSLPLYFFSLHEALAASVFLKLVVAGLCAYYAARRFHFTPPYALFIAFSFQMSGPLLVGHWRPVTDVMPWFPLLLPGIQRLLLGDYRIWPFLALLVGIMTLGGDPETLAAVFLFALLLICFYSLRNYQRDYAGGATAMLLISAGIGLCLAGAQLIPYMEFLRLGTIDAGTTDSFQWSDVGALLARDTRRGGAGLVGGAWLWLPSGAIAFLLVPLWLALRAHGNRPRRRRLESLLLATLLFMALAPALTPWLRLIPGLSHFAIYHFWVPLPLAAAFLAATALEEWVHLDADKCKEALRKLVWLLPTFWAVAFVAAWLLTRQAVPALPAIDSLRPAAMTAAVLFMLLTVTLLWPRPSLSAYALCLICIAFAWSTYAPHNHFTPSAQVFPETGFIRTLRSQNSRVTGTTRLQRWPLAAHGIAQTFSPSGAHLYRSREFMDSAVHKPELLRLTGSSALLLTRQDVQSEFAALRPVLNIQEVFPSGAILLKDLQTLPRARIAHTGRSRDVDRPAVLRSSGPPLLEGGTLPETAGQANASAIITDESLNHIAVTGESGRPGVLILSDAWYPGWQASLNENIEPVFPVDIAFRGVEISEGTHEVVFRYQPLSWEIGLYITAVAALVILGGCYNWFRNWRNSLA